MPPVVMYDWFLMNLVLICVFVDCCRIGATQVLLLHVQNELCVVIAKAICGRVFF